MSDDLPSYDVFLSCPMAGTRSGDEYQALRAEAMRVVDCLEQECGLSVFFAGRHVVDEDHFNEPDFSLIEDMTALQRSTYFLLLYSEPLVSSVLVEAGMAVAWEKKAVYFVRDPKDLPFMLRYLDRVRPVKIYEFKSVNRVLKLFRDHGQRLFEPWADPMGSGSGSGSGSKPASEKSSHAFEPQDKLGPFTLIEKLGEGTFGVVWRAQRRSSFATTEFAIKFPATHDLDRETITNEAQVWAKASGHPNILPVIEADLYDGHIGIVTEYAPDGCLQKKILFHEREPASTDTAVGLGVGILSGLDHLHRRGIVHRDMKPGNVLLQGLVPRIADFGLARILQSVDQTSSIGGTPAYMAPEAWEGLRSEQSDLWAVGVMLYELLAGRRPFPQKGVVRLRAAIARGEPEALPDEVPLQLREVIRKALAKEPDDRYRSAVEMRTELAACAELSAR